MPLLRNKNQPYFIDPDSPNNYQCGSEQYCHPVTVGDTIWSQFYQTPCNANEVEDPEFDDYSLGSELVLNGGFDTDPTPEWSFDPEWTWDAGNDEMDSTLNSGGVLTQAGLGLIDGQIYKVTFDCVVTNGQFDVIFGYGDPNQTQTPSITQTGSYEFDLIYQAGIGNDSITFYGALNFTGSIGSVSVKLISYDYWTTNDSWILADGQACHVPGQIGDLDENIANYIDANSYYKYEFTVSNMTTGSIAVSLSNATSGSITSNGNYTFWKTPTSNGVLTISASSTFDGCISNLAVYKLRNDYSAELIDSNDTVYDVSDAFDYYQDYVTLNFRFDTYELADGCYYLKVYDQCLIESDNLVINGDFVDGYTNWKRLFPAVQYDVTGDQMKFKFYPFGVGQSDKITNGDFSSGTTGWTFGTGWSLVGGNARHTAGNTATLTQAITLPSVPPPALGQQWYVKLTISNWTTGSVNVAIGSVNYNWKGNDNFIGIYSTPFYGNTTFTVTPTSDFDGDVGDFGIVATAVSHDIPLNSLNQPLYSPGTYEVSFDIVDVSDPNIKIRTSLGAGTPLPSYYNAVGTYTYTQNYNLNGGIVSLRTYMIKTSPYFPQNNYVAGYITVDNISVKKIEPFEATYLTECLNYNSNGFPRSKMLVGWCDQNAFGFEFDVTGFRLQQRAMVRSIAPTYPKSTIVMKMGTGDAKVAYSEIEKYWQLHTDFASETFHDAISAIISCDHFQIGDTEGSGVEYVAEAEDYTPNWQTDGSYSLATAVVNLRVKEKGQVFNRHI